MTHRHVDFFFGSVSYGDIACLHRAQDVQARLRLDVGYGAGGVEPGGHRARLSCRVYILANPGYWI